ncbi:MAG: hypothetical protein ABW185_18115 [Sedimenticola sp.]
MSSPISCNYSAGARGRSRLPTSMWAIDSDPIKITSWQERPPRRDERHSGRTNPIAPRAGSYVGE